MRGAPTRRLLVILGALIAIALMPSGASSDSDQSLQAEAACLVNLPRFIQWPSTAFEGPESPFVIGIVGKNPFGIDLAQLAYRSSARGRTFDVRQFHSRDDLRACQILFIGSKDEKLVTQIVVSLSRSSVLTVSDAAGFLDWGGMIELSNRGDQVRFAVNDGAARSVGIKAGANLLKLASEVIEGHPMGTN